VPGSPGEHGEHEQIEVPFQRLGRHTSECYASDR
jgi:hypothetical protein